MDTWHLPDGYTYSGTSIGLRSEPGRRDLAVIASVRPASAAGVFTQNQVRAAPVQLSQSRVPSAAARAVVICSGNANACTGEQGLRDAERMTELVAAGLGCDAEAVMVASTGVIGRPLPMATLEAGIPRGVANLRPGPGALSDAAHAVLTTDTVIKVSTRRTSLGHAVAGFAKGAAMIGPNLATMLGFVASDAPVSPGDLTDCLKSAAKASFNCVSVEGHTSTNDTVFALANGTGAPLTGAGLAEFAAALTAVCAELARAIASDAEGATHLLTLTVEGTPTDDDAHRVAKTVAESALVKTAIYGADPNWGRIVSAAGYAGVPFREAEASLWLGGHLVYDHGVPCPTDLAPVSGYLRDNRELTARLVLGGGPGRCVFYTCDLTTEYVKLNAEYTT